ncbi:MAG: hypothetical protein CME16_02550 [Gemmatimonadetes bacterium]|nr:hypothetical protein [Gemmatimonadota bacterium]
MDKTLIEIMALLGAQLSKEARKTYLDILPPTIKDEVSQRAPRGGDLGGSAIAGGQTLLKEFSQDSVAAGRSSRAANENEEIAGKSKAGRNSGSLVGALLSLVCLGAPRQKAADLVGHLPAWIQGQLVNRIASGNMLDISRGLAPPEAELVEELRAQCSTREEWGAKSAAGILRGIGDQGMLEQVVKATAARNDKVMEEVQNHLFVFEDLLLLSNPELQVLTMQVDNATLAQALCLSTEEVKKRLFQNVSARRARLIDEERELYEDATPEELQSAQGNVVNAMRTMYNSGKTAAYFGLLQEDSRPQGGGEVEQRRVLIEVAGDGEEEVAAKKVPEEEEEVEEKKGAPDKKNYRGWVLAALVFIGAPLLIWQLLGRSGERSDISTGSVGAKSAAGSGAESRVVGRVLAKGQKGDQGAEFSSSEPRLNQVGFKRKGPLALVDLDGEESRVEVLEENSRVFHEKSAPNEKSKGLYLQVGRLRTTILAEDFYLRTPVVKISGRPGTVFSTRVVLDATTYVEVEKGWVEIESLVDQGARYSLKGGQQGKFDPQSGSETNAIQVD